MITHRRKTLTNGANQTRLLTLLCGIFQKWMNRTANMLEKRTTAAKADIYHIADQTMRMTKSRSVILITYPRMKSNITTYCGSTRPIPLSRGSLASILS